MKSIRLLGPRQLEFRTDYPEPVDPSDGEALIRVRAVGICGSDLHLYQSGHIGNLGRGDPLIPGHEFMAEVLATGPQAIDGFGRPLRTGSRVAVEPHLPCHRCEWCERGDVNLCPHHTFIGLPGFDGALRERMTLPARACFPIPDDISDEAGALLEPLGVALHALNLAGRVLGKTVAVIGAGPIGLKVLRLCRLAGATSVVVIDPHAARLSLARHWGADQTIHGAAEDNLDAAMAATGGRGFDLVFECAWTGPALPPAVEMAAPGGKVMMVGIPDEEDTHLPHSAARRKGLSLIFVRRMKHTYAPAIRLAQGPSPSVALDELVSHRFPLEEAEKAFALNAAYADDVIKAIIRL